MDPAISLIKINKENLIFYAAPKEMLGHLSFVYCCRIGIIEGAIALKRDIELSLHFLAL